MYADSGPSMSFSAGCDHGLLARGSTSRIPAPQALPPLTDGPGARKMGGIDTQLFREIPVPRLIIPCCVVLVLALLTPAAEAGLREPPRRAPKPRTVGEAVRHLDTTGTVSREAFRQWTGLRPVDGAFSTRWPLADGVLVTNYMELAPGRLVIACWKVEKK
jgi:hypothetical protein